MIKTCKRCSKVAAHRKHSRGGFICYCLECEKSQNKQVRDNRKRYIVDSLGGKCSKCGIKDHPCIYDAHHIEQEGKLYNCSLVSNKTILDNELHKCKLLCIRCHREVEHEKSFSEHNRIWKRCEKCNENFWHELKRRHKNIDTPEKRQSLNLSNQRKMLKNWELGKEICQHHSSRRWNYKEWNSYCQKIFGIGSRGANDYERLFKEFSVGNLPSSLNGVRTGKHASNLIDEKSITYVNSICAKCDSNRRKERKDKVKDRAIAYLGGECYACNLTLESRAFDFHHVDPSVKEFQIARKSSFNDKLIKELDKCVLLCCYCHRKVHSGVLSLIDPLTF